MDKTALSPEPALMNESDTLFEMSCPEGRKEERSDICPLNTLTRKPARGVLARSQPHSSASGRTTHNAGCSTLPGVPRWVPQVSLAHRCSAARGPTAILVRKGHHADGPSSFTLAVWKTSTSTWAARGSGGPRLHVAEELPGNNSCGSTTTRPAAQGRHDLGKVLGFP